MRARSITNKARKNGVFLDDQELIKMIRRNAMLEIAKRNLEFVRICEKNNVTYNSYYKGIFQNVRMNLNYVNSMLKFIGCSYKIQIINDKIHKVYQSKMNQPN